MLLANFLLLLPNPLPHSLTAYYLYRHPPTSSKSLLNLLTSRVLPLLVNSARPDRPWPSLTILNSGSVRFDIFKGDFTRNDQWIMLPFSECHFSISLSASRRRREKRKADEMEIETANTFQFVPDVPRSIAHKLLPYLNLVGEHHLASLSPSSSSLSTSNSSFADQLAALHLPTDYQLPSLDLSHPHAQAAAVELSYRRRLAVAYSLSSPDSEDDSNAETNKKPDHLTPGYVTADSCGAEKGDDTLHRPIPAVFQPTFVSTSFPSPRWHEEGQQEKVDIVFFDFIQPDILGALNVLAAREGRGTKKWEKGDVGVYVKEEELTANTLMQVYAGREWN